jgi:glutamyl-tRNA synthetase
MGGVRTALYCYLFAKKNNGDFILRIEDTDQTRFVSGAEQYILEALDWCGLHPDESIVKGGDSGPYRQSERKEIYQKYADQLIKSGYAYYAFDSAEELEAMRERLKAEGAQDWHYNARSRNSMVNSLTLSENEVHDRISTGEKFVIRLKVPPNERITFTDLVRGDVEVNTNTMDDKVIFKSDGMPTYHLANVVDDYLMRISHVIRGEEWLPSAPLHLLLYRYLGWEKERPEFAHLPLILKPNGNGKLSKRDGDKLGFPVFPIEWKDPQTETISSGYREQGYFPEAFINMLALLGWNPGDNRELFSLEEMVHAFSIERVNKAGAKFDPNKTKWFQEQYLRMQSDETLAKIIQPLATERGWENDLSYLAKVCELMKPRSVFAPDLLEGKYFFEAPTSYDAKTVRKKWKEHTATHMLELNAAFQALKDFSATSLEKTLKEYMEQHQLSFGALLPNFRLLLTGLGNGPSLFEIAALLGKSEVNDRMVHGIKAISDASED